MTNRKRSKFEDFKPSPERLVQLTNWQSAFRAGMAAARNLDQREPGTEADMEETRSEEQS
jgi:hypothetical protein